MSDMTPSRGNVLRLTICLKPLSHDQFDWRGLESSFEIDLRDVTSDSASRVALLACSDIADSIERRLRDVIAARESRENIAEIRRIGAQRS